MNTSTTDGTWSIYNSTLSPREEILKRLLDEKHISFEELIVLLKPEVRIEYVNHPPYPHFYDVTCFSKTQSNDSNS